jgi:hypothetical protein
LRLSPPCNAGEVDFDAILDDMRVHLMLAGP